MQIQWPRWQRPKKALTRYLATISRPIRQKPASRAHEAACAGQPAGTGTPLGIKATNHEQTTANRSGTHHACLSLLFAGGIHALPCPPGPDQLVLEQRKFSPPVAFRRSGKLSGVPGGRQACAGADQQHDLRTRYSATGDWLGDRDGIAGEFKAPGYDTDAPVLSSCRPCCR